LEHALAVLLESRTPVLRVRPLAQGSPSHWQEHPGFSSGQGRGRRQRQYQARIGREQVSISGDAEELTEDPCGERLAILLAGLSEAYR
jgi:hypothetical protein